MQPIGSFRREHQHLRREAKIIKPVGIGPPRARDLACTFDRYSLAVAIARGSLAGRALRVRRGRLPLSHGSRALIRFAFSAGAAVGNVPQVEERAGFVNRASEGEAVAVGVAAGQDDF